MVIYNVECKTKEELIQEIYETIKENKGVERANRFRLYAQNTKHKSQVIMAAKYFTTIEYRDSVECCLYCEEKLKKEGLYCDSICEELDKEERAS